MAESDAKQMLNVYAVRGWYREEGKETIHDWEKNIAAPSISDAIDNAKSRGVFKITYAGLKMSDVTVVDN